MLFLFVLVLYSSAFFQPKALMVAPRGFSPKAEWVRAQISNFATVRQVRVVGYHLSYLDKCYFDLCNCVATDSKTHSKVFGIL